MKFRKTNLSYNEYMELKDTKNCETLGETVDKITISFKKNPSMYSDHVKSDRHSSGTDDGIANLKEVKGCGKKSNWKNTAVNEQTRFTCGVLGYLCKECQQDIKNAPNQSQDKNEVGETVVTQPYETSTDDEVVESSPDTNVENEIKKETITERRKSGGSIRRRKSR